MSPGAEAWFLREWQRNGPAQLLLRPLSWVFGLLAAVRRLAFKLHFLRTRSVSRPVIVVGNITAGGTGKTPLVAHIVNRLAAAGMPCGIVTRGYRRGAPADAANAVIHVDPATTPPAAVGDEALLLARLTGAPVVAAADRVAAAEALVARHPDVAVIVSDDGLQHYALHRDLEICVVDGARGLGNGALMPAGPLREPPSRLARVDALVLNRTLGATGVSRFDAASLPVAGFSMEYAGESFIAPDGEVLDPARALDHLRGHRVAAMAGIGHPQRFFSHLARLGLALDSIHAMPDHHEYQPHDLASIEADAIVVTAKDAVKLASFADKRVWVLAIKAVLPAAFDEFLLAKVTPLVPHHVR